MNEWCSWMTNVYTNVNDFKTLHNGNILRTLNKKENQNYVGDIKNFPVDFCCCCHVKKVFRPQANSPSHQLKMILPKMRTEKVRNVVKALKVSFLDLKWTQTWFVCVCLLITLNSLVWKCCNTFQVFWKSFAFEMDLLINVFFFVGSYLCLHWVSAEKLV